MHRLIRKKAGRPRGDEKVQITVRLSQKAYAALWEHFSARREALGPKDAKITLGDVVGEFIMKGQHNEGEEKN